MLDVAYTMMLLEHQMRGFVMFSSNPYCKNNVFMQTAINTIDMPLQCIELFYICAIDALKDSV